ncbi:hypothetical protein SBF1_50020 [Candidatus Desulfosporosinus infrequens]|uniref:Uncharacterized protein n=1 Tax=Candidatus Desulfosporosinus infrequens TaxID=2043169 RepID=A0A2U3LH50_9FIRM|nr:hypothetical protein SBF1_50020 [Candidatus Desulfosporosinus infrequens]
MEPTIELNPLDDLLSLIQPEQRNIARDFIAQMADINIIIKKLSAKINGGTAKAKDVTMYYSGTRAYANLVDKLLKMLPDAKGEETKDDLLEFLQRYAQ